MIKMFQLRERSLVLFRLIHVDELALDALEILPG